MAGTKVIDFYDDEEAFEDVLRSAEGNATGKRAMEFLDQLRDGFEEWGLGLFLSDAQQQWLERLAEDE